ncbi:MAG: division/cell wall cluster transcriptional repressor MraZ [Saprospiraceae bacterium]|jgi:MraZ protein
MYKLSGEYEVKIDDRGRLRLPSVLLRQFGASASTRFVVNRGFEKCLLLYPIEAWDEKTKEVDQLSLYSTKERTFARFFYRGATEVIVDGSERILLPKSLMEHAGIEHEIFLLAYQNKVEIWSKENYLKMIDEEPDDFAALAEEVFRRKDV